MTVEERINQIVEESQRRMDAMTQDFKQASELMFHEIRSRHERDTYRIAVMLTIVSISMAAMPIIVLTVAKILASS